MPAMRNRKDVNTHGFCDPVAMRVFPSPPMRAAVMRAVNGLIMFVLLIVIGVVFVHLLCCVGRCVVYEC